MGSVPNHEWPSSEDPNNTQRKTELLNQEIEAAAKAVALGCGFPWELLALREYGRQYVARPGVLGAWREYDRSQGHPFPHQTYIRKELLRYAKALRARKEEGIQLSPPLEKSVSEAYRVYSKDEWKDLITKLDHTDIRPLLLYLRDNKDTLTQDPGAWLKYGAVFGAAANRSMTLLFSRGEWVATPISDPLWAALWEEVGAPPTSKHRTSAELHGPRAIAEALGYDPENKHKQVADWLERMKEWPFEKYVEKCGGDLSDYLT